MIFSRNKNKNKNKNGKVVICGWPGSGSTYLYQLANEFYEGVEKTHGLPKLIASNFYLFTIRDPRDIITSGVRRQSREIEIEKGKDEALNFELLRLEKIGFKNDYIKALRCPNVIIIRYESLIKGSDPKNLIEFLMSQSGKYLSVTDSEKLILKYSLEKNMEESKKLGDFSNFNPETKIHGNHISNNGNIGGWKEFFTSDFENKFRSKYGLFVDSLGY